jgi:hypothetical protein
MKYFFLLASIVGLSSCGNPHISSSRSSLERLSPPITTNTYCSETAGEDYTFYFGKQSETSFRKTIACKNPIEETFISFDDGQVYSLTNEDKLPLGYTLLYRNELENQEQKVQYLDDIFGRQSFLINIESPVSKNGVNGKDRGVTTWGTDTETKDAFVWSFSQPISYWSTQAVDLHSAKLRLFDCSQALIKDVTVNYDGSGELQHLSFVSNRKNICHVSLTVSEGSTALAIDEFSYGQ